MDAPNFPAHFLDDLADAPGFDRDTFIKAHLSPSPTSVRINPNKQTVFASSQPVPWCRDGFYLAERPSFTFDPLFHAGCYYVQEASSMFIDTIMRTIKAQVQEPLKVLDLCAAPGGKSTLLASVINADDLLVANEIIKTRVPVLTDNLSRWGNANIIATNNDARDFSRLPGFFNVILVDAPCSGSGMFRKDTGAINEWSESNVKLCHQRQERILADVYPALAENGYLIYSTCSYSPQENEQVLDWLCETFGMESMRINIADDWGIVETQSDRHKAWGYRFYPDKVKGEGLFAACLIKREGTGNTSAHKHKFQKLNSKEIDPFRQYITNGDEQHFFKVGDDWLVIPEVHKESMLSLQHNLYLKKSGIRLGKMAGKDLIPDHELALSLIINKNTFQQTELTLEQAIAYLRRDDFKIDTQQRGWSLMAYHGQVLGWAKLLPNRINNYYPKELRILSSPAP